MTSELKSLFARLDKIERRNRQLSLLAFGSLLAVVVMFVSAFASPKSRVVDAERIVVHDSQGRARITLGTPASSGAAIDLSRDQPAIWITDSSGTDRTIITMNSIVFADEHGRPVSPNR